MTEQFTVLSQGVTGQIKPEHLFFSGQQLSLLHFRDFWQINNRLIRVSIFCITNCIDELDGQFAECNTCASAALGGDVTKVAGYEARFAGVGFPGETYAISYWNEDGKILIAAQSKAPVRPATFASDIIAARRNITSRSMW